MILAKTIFAISLVLLPLSAQDTKENRTKQAERYLKAMSLKDMMMDYVEQMKVNQPPEKQAWIENMFKNFVDFKQLEKLLVDALVETMSADEIGALADFYSSPIGKSSMKKFGKCMATMYPAMQDELLKAVERSNSSPFIKQ